MKVYCGDCKYLKRLDGYGYPDTYYTLCSKNPDILESYLSKEYEMKRCSDKNRNNDCPDFKPSFWKRMKDIFGWNS